MTSLDTQHLPAPTADDFRDALHAVLGYAGADVWAQVCRTAELDPRTEDLTGSQLTALAAAISSCPGRVGRLGRDIGTRVATYRALVDAGRPGGSGPPTLGG